MNRKKKENIFLWKKGNFSFITKKKKKKQTNVFFIKRQMFIIYRYFLFGEERGGVYFKLKYLLPYLQFFLTLSKNIFGKSV